MKKILLLGAATLLFPFAAGAQGYVSLQKAKDWLSKNEDKCVFAAVRTYRGKTKEDQSTLAMLGAKPNDVERFSNPHRTPALCVYNGERGRGANAEQGCLVSWYFLDLDRYEPFKFTRNGRFAEGFLPGKCDAAKTRKLLLEYNFSDSVSVGPYLSDGEVWSNFNDGFRGNLEADIHILTDKFDLKSELDNAIKASASKKK